MTTKYEPYISESRVKDFELPESIILGGESVKIPKSLRQKMIHYLLDDKGKPIKVAWLEKALAHTLNSMRFENNPKVRRSELKRALDAVDSKLSHLIKDMQRQRRGTGAMAFAQAHENVPKDSIVITERTYRSLVRDDPRWQGASRVICTRYPNLGPETTKALKLVVDGSPLLDVEDLRHKPLTVFARISTEMQELLRNMCSEDVDPAEINEDEYAPIDAFFLHPDILKGCFEGDGDGDLLFTKVRGRRGARFDPIDWTRKPKPLDEILDKGKPVLDVLINKAKRQADGPLDKWIVDQFDDLPIGQATYMIRTMWRQEIAKLAGKVDHPGHEAWKIIAPEAIKIAELVFDIRKSEHTPQEVDQLVLKLNRHLKATLARQKCREPFACAVTSRCVTHLPAFLNRFPALQNFVDYIFAQNKEA